MPSAASQSAERLLVRRRGMSSTSLTTGGPGKSPSSASADPDVSISPPVHLDLFDVVVGFGERDVLGEHVRVVATGGGPVVDIAIASVVGSERAIDRAVALQALAKVVRAELDVLLRLEQVFLLEPLEVQRSGNLGACLRNDLRQTF